jgi:hypothetical protein
MASVPGTSTRWKSSILSTNVIAVRAMSTIPTNTHTRPTPAAIQYQAVLGRISELDGNGWAAPPHGGAGGGALNGGGGGGTAPNGGGGGG